MSVGKEEGNGKKEGNNGSSKQASKQAITKKNQPISAQINAQEYEQVCVLYACTPVCMYVPMYACMGVCMYASMLECLNA